MNDFVDCKQTADTHKKILKQNVINSVTAWGMSETSPMALMSPINNIVLGSCGVPVPNSEFKIGNNSEENYIRIILCFLFTLFGNSFI